MNCTNNFFLYAVSLTTTKTNFSLKKNFIKGRSVKSFIASGGRQNLNFQGVLSNSK